MRFPWKPFSLVLVFFVAASVLPAADSIEFNRDIRPILADKCFACHGPDKNKREAELRLDTEAGALHRAEGPVIVPGKPDDSELIRRLVTADVDERMPPASSQKTISAPQIELLKRWIAEGAKYQPHWSLLPPVKTDPPSFGEGWGRNAVDRFVAGGHQRNGMTPSPDAEPRVLVRRLYFDLLGLPPAPQEVDEFVQNPTPQAYEELVDRLLASPHFGERMAMYWLDVVRYADSGGYHSDNDRDVTLYRDYVIRAFNDNMRFDQFTVEQLAGDLLPNATTQQKVASGYNRLLQTTEEGGAQPKEYTAKYQADRVRNTSVAWLGITMGCCECHDHKYDPLSTRDFYSMGAFFADIQEKAVGRQDQIALPTPEQDIEHAKLIEELRPLQQQYLADRPEIAAGQATWEEQLRRELAEGKHDWIPATPDKVSSVGGTTLTLQEDKSLLASGENPDQETYVVALTAGKNPVTGIRLEALTHASLTNGSLSRANGNVVLTEVEVTARAPDSESKEAIKFSQALADFAQKGLSVEAAIDGKQETGWGLAGHEKAADHQAVFVCERPIPAGHHVEIKLKHESKFAKHQLGRFRISLTSTESPGLKDKGSFSQELLQGLAAVPAQRTMEQKKALSDHYRSIAPELASLRQQIATVEKRKQDLEKSFPKTLISVSIPPRVVRVLPRGNWLDDTGEVMEPNVPASLPPLKIENRQLARLDFARWVVSRDNPLTARVFVNRLWKLFYGQGIVKTLDDFGIQGSTPTHPELLDWLAVEFIDSGWDIKHIVKLMVMSRTYQQSSNPVAALRERDPTNQWLARQSAFRFDAEIVRDNALAISGLLSRKIGGGNARPYQPAGYWRFLNFPVREWANDKGENQYRRGLYTHWQRTFLHPSLLAFDAPTREECTVERPRSNTPLQALVLLNDPTYVEAARTFAWRVVNEGGKTDSERLTFGFRQALGRSPNDKESELLLSLLKKHQEEYGKEPANADTILKVGDQSVPGEASRVELAAWTSVARVILNLHETITRN